jgi:hypothetical protein
MILVIEGADVEVQQGNSKSARRRFGRKSLAAALHAEQQDALRRIETAGTIR